MLIELHIDDEKVKEAKKICSECHIDFDCNPTIFPVKGFYDYNYKDFYKETYNISYEDRYEALSDDSNKSQYGVADNIEQIQEYFKEQIEDSNVDYIIELIKIEQHKENAGKGNGWRWHKWGTYIGKFNPQCEYLDDEEFGEDFQGYVLCFNLNKVSNK